MVANIVEKMMVAFWLCTELSTTFVDMGGLFITQVEGHIQDFTNPPRAHVASVVPALESDLGTARITTAIRATGIHPILPIRVLDGARLELLTSSTRALSFYSPISPA